MDCAEFYFHFKPTLQAGTVGCFALIARVEHAKSVNAT